MNRDAEDDGDEDTLPVEREERRRLEDAAERFLAALRHRDAGGIDRAEDLLRDLLRTEPRLAEPRMELARILLDTDRLEEAEDQARTALEQLEGGGQWTDDLPENVVLALAHALLAEVLRRRADEDDVIFGDAAVYRRLVEESRTHFEKASALDPADEYASYHAFFLGARGHGGADRVEEAHEEGDEEGDET